MATVSKTYIPLFGKVLPLFKKALHLSKKRASISETLLPLFRKMLPISKKKKYYQYLEFCLFLRRVATVSEIYAPLVNIASTFVKSTSFHQKIVSILSHFHILLLLLFRKMFPLSRKKVNTLKKVFTILNLAFFQRRVATVFKINTFTFWKIVSTFQKSTSTFQKIASIFQTITFPFSRKMLPFSRKKQLS